MRRQGRNALEEDSEVWLRVDLDGDGTFLWEQESTSCHVLTEE